MLLPILESCNDCGACCCHTPLPPFQPGEDIVREVPAELMELIHVRIALDQQFDLLPCVWYDAVLRNCRHYELRPTACRDFQIGSDLCRLSRWDEGIE